MTTTRWPTWDFSQSMAMTKGMLLLIWVNKPLNLNIKYIRNNSLVDFKNSHWTAGIHSAQYVGVHGYFIDASWTKKCPWPVFFFLHLIIWPPSALVSKV